MKLHKYMLNIDIELFRKASAKAKLAGKTFRDIIIDFLKSYIK